MDQLLSFLDSDPSKPYPKSILAHNATVISFSTALIYSFITPTGSGHSIQYKLINSCLSWFCFLKFVAKLCLIDSFYHCIICTDLFSYTRWWRCTVERTSVFGRWTFPVARSTFSWWVTTYVGKHTTGGQLTRPTQPFISSGSIMSSKLQLDVRHLNRWRRHLVDAYDVTAGMVLFQLQVKLCDPCLSASKWFVYHARRYTSALLNLFLNGRY